jgi:hypothetical protein
LGYLYAYGRKSKWINVNTPKKTSARRQIKSVLVMVSKRICAGNMRRENEIKMSKRAHYDK